MAVRIGRAGKQAKMDAKTVVMGMRERGGRVRAFVVRTNRRGTLLPRIWKHVEPGATLYTDSLRSYQEAKEKYVHHVINHAKAYIEGRVHTNNVESFWSVLKRTIAGTYVAPRAFHLDAYLDERVPLQRAPGEGRAAICQGA